MFYIDYIEMKLGVFLERVTRLYGGKTIIALALAFSRSISLCNESFVFLDSLFYRSMEKLLFNLEILVETLSVNKRYRLRMRYECWRRCVQIFAICILIENQQNLCINENKNGRTKTSHPVGRTWT